MTISIAERAIGIPSLSAAQRRDLVDTTCQIPDCGHILRGHEGKSVRYLEERTKRPDMALQLYIKSKEQNKRIRDQR